MSTASTSLEMLAEIEQEELQVAKAKTYLIGLTPRVQARVFMFLREIVGAPLGQSSAEAPKASKSILPSVVGTSSNPTGSYTDRAEKFVLERKGGASTDDVGRAIGQANANAHGTLRHVEKTRQTIENRDGKWFPKSGAKASAQKTSIRQLILDVFQEAGDRALLTSEAFDRALRLRADLKRGSFDADMSNLRREGVLKMVEVLGKGGTYTLAKAAGGASSK